MMVRLFAANLGIVINSTLVANKQGEGSGVKKILKSLNIKGVFITLDALHCQKK